MSASSRPDCSRKNTQNTRHPGHHFWITGSLYIYHGLVTCGISLQRPVIRNFDVVVVVNLGKPLNKQSNCRWFQMPWRSCHVRVKYNERNNVSCVPISTGAMGVLSRWLIKSPNLGNVSHKQGGIAETVKKCNGELGIKLAAIVVAVTMVVKQRGKAHWNAVMCQYLHLHW